MEFFRWGFWGEMLVFLAWEAAKLAGKGGIWRKNMKSWGGFKGVGKIGVKNGGNGPGTAIKKLRFPQDVTTSNRSILGGKSENFRPSPGSFSNCPIRRFFHPFSQLFRGTSSLFCSFLNIFRLFLLRLSPSFSRLFRPFSRRFPPIFSAPFCAFFAPFWWRLHFFSPASPLQTSSKRGIRPQIQPQFLEAPPNTNHQKSIDLPEIPIFNMQKEPEEGK